MKESALVEKCINGDLKALWIIGEDVVQTDPNTQKVIKAMDSVDLLIVQEIFMTETARHATVILPGASFLEKSGTFTNGERRIQRVNKVVEPLAGTKSDGKKLLASGGRVLTVTGIGSDLTEARNQAYRAISQINLTNSFYRSDIALNASVAEKGN